MGSKPNYNHIEMMANILWDMLEENPPKTEKQLKELVIKAKAKYVSDRGLTGCTTYPNNYLMEAKKEILNWGFSYDEALQVVNINYGYNPNTGKWDGTYEGCKIGRRRGA